MGNILDYLEWRGDLPLAVSPFNEIDNLALACVSYVDPEGCVPGIGEGSVSVEEAAEKYFSLHTEEELRERRTFIKFSPFVFQAMAKTERFRHARLQNQVSLLDQEKELQFSAIEILTDDGVSYVSFRGTDDTIVGWKEDFNLSYRVVPAELEAVRYLDTIHRGRKEQIRTGGHSKGGHMAVYAAAKCREDIRSRIIAIYNNDGPGCNENLLNDRAVSRIAPMIRRYIPETSLIGTLMDHVSTPVILKSSAKGLMQHAPVSWMISGPHFDTQEELSPTGQLLSSALREWIYQVDMADRKEYIDDLFSVFEASGMETLTELQENILKAAVPMLDRLNELSPKTRETTRLLVRTLFEELMEEGPLAQLKERLSGTAEQNEAERAQRQEQLEAAREQIQEHAEAAVEKLQNGIESVREKYADFKEQLKEI